MSDTELVSLQRTLYESRNPTRRWLHKTRQEWICRTIERLCVSGQRALEIGPGSGIYIPTLKNACAEVYVADCEKAYLSAIEDDYAGDPRVKLVVDDITRSKLPDRHFDLVLCTEVVEHIADSRAALQHIARIMKPDGVLVLSTPQRYSSLELTARVALSPWLIGLTRLVYHEPVLEMGHINLMTATTVQEQLAAAHFRLLEQHKGGLYVPGLAEFFGKWGQRVASRVERSIRRSRFDGVLWTQYYVVKLNSGQQIAST